PINDRYGHRAGDAAIREVANRLTAEVRESDTAARIGGDEFALVLTTVDSHQSARLVAERIAARCDASFEFEAANLEISASVGVALFPEDGNEPEVLIEKADQSMYLAKRAKKLAQRDCVESNQR